MTRRRASASGRTSGRTSGRAAAVLVVLALGGCRSHEDANEVRPGAASAATTAATKILYPSAPGSFVDLISSARHGVVAIRAGAPVKSGPAAVYPGTPDGAVDTALGTGFLIESGGVFVLTTDHIAAAATDLRVVLPDRHEAPAKLVGRDIRLDVALLSIDGGNGARGDMAPLALGNSDDLQVGEWLVVLGNPFGEEVSASVGIVSATGRAAAGSLMADRTVSFRTFIQTDARVHRGNSGGPVLDAGGQVVGIAVATSDRPGEASFVIPINRVKEIVDPLRNFGQVTRSWLGVLVKPVDPELAVTVGLARPSGAVVTEVKAGSPAARAALRVGDIILAWDKREVDHRSLPWIVSQTPVGRPIAVTVWRNRAASDIAVVPDKMPE